MPSGICYRRTANSCRKRPTIDTAPPRYTVLRDRHDALGASFTDFGGLDDAGRG